MTWLILYDDFMEHQILDKILYHWLKLKEYSYCVHKLLDNSLYFKPYSGVIILWQWKKAETHQIILDKIKELCHEMLRQTKYNNDLKLYIVLDFYEGPWKKIGLSLSNYSLSKLQKLIGMSRNIQYRSFDPTKFKEIDVKAYKKFKCKYNDSFMI